MGRKVARVCGAATEISLNGERDTPSFGKHWVHGTLDDAVVLVGPGDALQVADAQAFCAGSVEVRRLVELPRDATPIGRNTRVKYGVAVRKKQREDAGAASEIYIAGFQIGGVVIKSLPTLSEEIVDAFVDARGKQVVVVGGTTGKLWGWNPCDCDFDEDADAWRECEWREVTGTAVDSRSADSCSCGKFISSSVMGNCFVYLRATRFPNGSVVLEKRIFDVDARWSPISFSSREIGNLDPGTTHGLKIFTTNTWTQAVVTVGSMLYHVRIDEDLRNSSVRRFLLAHQIIDGAWVDDENAFALLHLNGQVSVGCVHESGCIELLAIATSSTMSKRLSLSALLGKAVSAALGLVWIAQEKQVVIDFGTSCIAFKLLIEGEERPEELSRSNAFAAICRRRVRASLDKNDSDLSGFTQRLLESRSTPTSHETLDIARIALRRSWRTFESLYFTLLSIIHQQLAGAFVNAGKSRDPIDCVGKSLRLMEVLVSLTISLDASTLHQVGAKILSAHHGCASDADRKVYYRKEINAMLRQVRLSVSGVSESEDWWSYSMETTTFLRVYFTTVLELVQEVYSDDSPVQQKSIGASDIFSICRLITEHDECSAAFEPVNHINRRSGSLLVRLKHVLISYTLMCRCLQVNGVVFDLGHLFSIDLSPTLLKRKELICCFMTPWQHVRDETFTVAGQSSNRLREMVVEAAKYAAEANALQLIITFCLESRSLLVHPCLQILCKAAVTMAEVKPPDKLHWMACEVYIGEAMAIFQRFGAMRQFRYPIREVASMENGISPPRAIDNKFGVYLRMLSTELANTPANRHADCKQSALWGFSNRDTILCARVACLVSRIVWHLEAMSGGFGYLIQHSFGLDLFDPRQRNLLAENEAVHDCVTMARQVIMPTEAELRLPTLDQTQGGQAPHAIESQKIGRTVVLIAWALWLREKTAYCTRSYHTLSDGDPVAEKETLGALAATCALHLNAVGMLCGYHEDLLSIQLTLLEEAAAINPCKCAAIVAWGFPQHKILTRQLKRYKGLRQELRQATLQEPLDERELRYQQVHKRIRRAFIQLQEMNENTEIDKIDMLISSCCDPELLQIMAVLTRSPYDVVSSLDVPNPVVQDDSDPFPERIEEAPPSQIHAETVPDPISHVEEIPKPQISESLISRDEVIALLQAQARHLEEKIQAVTSVSTPEPSRSSSSPDDVRKTKNVAALHAKPAQPVTDLADTQRMARISLQVLNLNRQRYPSVYDVQPNQQPKPAQRHDSIRNALKLFRLRQENGSHLRDQEGSNRFRESGIPKTREASQNVSKSERDTQDSTALSPRDRLSNAGVKRKPTRSQRSEQDQCPASKEPVYPLRLEYGADSASLKLLGRNSRQRNPSVKRRQFVHESEQTKTYAYQAKARVAFSAVEAVQMKNCGAQTNDMAESVDPPAHKEKKEIGPETRSPVAQDSTEDEHVASSLNFVNSSSSLGGVSTQCRETKDGSTQANRVRRLRGPPPLTIADKFPIWVDLDGSGSGGEKKHFKERKHFLRVARFGSPNTTDTTINNDSAGDSPFLPISPSISVVFTPRKLSSEDGSEENQSDGRYSPTHSSVQAEEDRATQQTNEAVNATYRASYRQHYPSRQSLNGTSDEIDSASGIDTLIGLRDNMQRMTQRLRVLETCANSIDEEFKVSQKRLSRIGDKTSHTNVLDNIDKVLEVTDELDGPPGGRRPKGGLLSKKASSDLNAAKKLLETIEQLTISANDE